MRRILAVLLLAGLALSGCTEKPLENDPHGTPAWIEPMTVAAGCFEADDTALDHEHPKVTFTTNFGDITAEVYQAYVPTTADAFLDRVRDGYYDGIPFHRIITDFMMQGGNGALAPGDSRSSPQIPDEFHHRLRHDGKGMLSMANAGPNTGSDQFFITFGPTPHLDDWHTVFGQVVSGFDVLDTINEEAASSGGTPTQDVILESAVVSDEGQSDAEVAFGLLSPDAVQKVSTRGGETAYALIVENCEDDAYQVTVSVSSDAADVSVQGGMETFILPGAQRQVVGIDADVDSGDGEVKITVTVSSGGVSHDVDLTAVRASDTGRARVQDGETVEAHYIGMLLDGRVFDTSFASVADDDRIAKFDKTWSDRARGETFQFTPGSGVIPGFTKLAIGTQEGSTNAGSFAPVDGYGEAFQPGQNIFNGHPLTGKPLFFELEVVDIVT